MNRKESSVIAALIAGASLAFWPALSGASQAPAAARDGVELEEIIISAPEPRY
ncbi:MAG: hypothetical protein RLZZ403_1262, partial [Pseudomonadota bacterium]